MNYDFGNRLQQLLNQNNMTQRKLANKIGVTEAAISRYINDLQKPRPDILADIATALKMCIRDRIYCNNFLFVL